MLLNLFSSLFLFGFEVANTEWVLLFHFSNLFFFSPFCYSEWIVIFIIFWFYHLYMGLKGLMYDILVSRHSQLLNHFLWRLEWIF
jgi:hypothetical protein